MATSLVPQSAGADPAEISAPQDGRSPDPSDWHTALGFLVMVLLEMSFVLALLLITKCTQWEAVRTATAVTTVAASCYYARNALLVIGRRLVGNDTKHQ